MSIGSLIFRTFFILGMIIALKATVFALCDETNNVRIFFKHHVFELKTMADLSLFRHFRSLLSSFHQHAFIQTLLIFLKF